MPGGEGGTRRRLLILGGTPEAARLALGAVERVENRLEVISSLAGRTSSPAPLPGSVRRGGFGGPGGLADYLAKEKIDCVIDATHPFAAQISAHGRQACEAKGVPRLALLRPPWRREGGDDWLEVDGIEDAAELLRSSAALGGRVFLTTGPGSLAPFVALADRRFLVRLIEAPKTPLGLGDFEVIIGRGPFTVEGERALMVEKGIGVLISKASGGGATYAKIIAARQLSLPVIMIRRPAPEPGMTVETVEAALDWLDGALV
jgi:precorrin-6A/cobalt-precorrin-6A reductase